MSLRFLNEIRHAQGLKQGARGMLRNLADAADAKGISWRKQETLAADCGCCVKSVHNHLKTLEAVGWIERWEDRKPGGKRGSDFIRVRTFAEAKAWAVENVKIPGERDPANDAAPAGQPVNTSTPFAGNITGPVDEIQRDLTIRLQSEGLDLPAPPARSEPRKETGS